MTAFVFALALVLFAGYGLLSWHYLGHLRGAGRWPRVPRTEHLLLGGLLLGHTFLVLAPLLWSSAFDLGVGRALSTVVWLMLLIYWTGGFFYRVEGLQLLMLPLAALAMLFELIFPGHHPAYHLRDPLFAVHLLVSMVAYSLFAIGALIAVLMLVLERALHARRSSPLVRQLPPLLSLEKMMFQALWSGFVLLSLSLVSGVMFSEQLFGKPVELSHKIVFSAASWLVFGALLFGRARYGWRGRVAIRWTLLGFALLLLGYIGSKIVLELILQR